MGTVAWIIGSLVTGTTIGWIVHGPSDRGGVLLWSAELEEQAWWRGVVIGVAYCAGRLPTGLRSRIAKHLKDRDADIDSLKERLTTESDFFHNEGTIT